MDHGSDVDQGEKTGNTNQSFSPKQHASSVNTDRNLYNRWCFTLNNYTMDQMDQLIDYFNKNCKYNKFDNKIRDYQFQEEIGSEGTPHIQGRFTLKERLRFTKLKKDIGIPSLHLEKENNEEASKAYCVKSDTSTGKQYSGTSATALIKIKLMVKDAKLKLNHFENNYEINLWKYPLIIYGEERAYTKCYWYTIDELIDIDNWIAENMALYLEHTNYITHL